MTIGSEAVRGAAVPHVPPPLYFVAGLAVGMLADGLVRFPVGGRPVSVFTGIAVVVAGLAFGAGGVAGVARHRTTIVPHHPVATLVTTGVYGVSRNPMYTGLAVAYLGGALLLGSWWPVVFWPLVVLAVRRLVIRPEEQYLGRRFGQDYRDYQARVRRWL